VEKGCIETPNEPPALGKTGAAADADPLREALLDAALREDAMPGQGDEHGQRYVIEFVITGPVGSATVRSAWIVRADEVFPRFVSCYVL